MNQPYKDFHRRLHAWYGAHGRKDLPWRNTRDPYAIYISEIMLQQTQVATVLDRYYFPFLKQFPTLTKLKEADRQDVLKCWQGLGYYNRAINLHKAAQQCNGALPDTVEGLIALPGIGRNTAHALAAFAHHLPVAVMEANVKRVLSRIFALQHPNDAQLWEQAQAMLDADAPFDYNQAMMDIGATVCTPRAPACPQCPAQAICKGKFSPESYPAPKSKKAVPVRRKYIAVLRNAQGQYHATPRKSRFLGGLYHFIETDADAKNLIFHGRCYVFDAANRIGRVRQQYSHFTLEADIHIFAGIPQAGKSWYSPAQLKKLPLSMAERKILALLDSLKPAKPKPKKTVSA